MRLAVVGCSGSVPGPASPASCYLLEADDPAGRTWRLLLDLGSGALGALQRYCDPREVDAVALSHLHPDHCADLAGLHTYLNYHPDGPSQCVVHGPFGTPGRLADLRGKPASPEVLAIHAWQAGSDVRIGPFVIRVEAVTHSVPAYAMRVEGPSETGHERAVIAYSGDCDVCDGLALVAAGADVFLCEASFLEEDDAPAGIHLTAAEAGRAAHDARCQRLVLTHLPPWGDPNAALAQAGKHYRGRVDVALPGMRIEL